MSFGRQAKATHPFLKRAFAGTTLAAPRNTPLSMVVYGETRSTIIVLPGWPSVSFRSILTKYSPGGASAFGMSMPVASVNGFIRGVRSTFGDRRKVTLMDSGSIFVPPKD